MLQRRARSPYTEDDNLSSASPAPGRRTLTGAVQRRAAAADDAPAARGERVADGDPVLIHHAAAEGVRDASAPLPHLDAIQRSFGPHDVSHVRAQVGGAGADAAAAMGAEAYATGDRVAFAEQPSLFVAAHEAAHVVQQRRGVQLLGGVGNEGDVYEQQADAVAERVVRGESAVDLLGDVRTPDSPRGQVQEKRKKKDKKKEKEKEDKKEDVAEGDAWEEISVFDLGTGDPRGVIDTAVTQIALASNRMMGHLTDAVETFIETIQHAEFKQADRGFMGKLWKHSEGLMKKASQALTGSERAGEMAHDMIDTVVSHSEELEQKRLEADEKAFLGHLRKVVAQAYETTAGDDLIVDIVTQLDVKFAELGTNPEDAWQKGQRGVIGAQAAFLQNLTSEANAYAKGIPSADQFRARFFTEWVNSNHKKRNRSPIRSPFDDSTYQDGYFSLDVKIDWTGDAWAFVEAGNATLHCPKSAEIAQGLMDNISGFDLTQVRTHHLINVTATDAAWDHMPERAKRDRTSHIWFTPGGSAHGDPAKEKHWSWLVSHTGTSHDELLARVTTLRGG